MIGLGQDDPEVLKSAANYVSKGGHPSRFHVEGGKLITSD